VGNNVYKPRGAPRNSKPEATGSIVKNTPVLGIVKDNIDPTRSGRIFVYLADNSGSDPDSRDNWVPVKYMSTFFGRTTPDAGNDNFGTYKANPSSYGEWHSPPDIGSTVVCFFINGDVNYGFYMGCLPEPEALQMVPAIGSSENIIANEAEANSYGGAVRLPVTNINTNNSQLANGPNYLNAPKPVHSYTASIMNQQGILRDPIRGPISTSAQRETPSRVGWGVSTPGRPIYEGGYTDETIAKNLDPTKVQGLKVVARRGGHSIVMDDGDIIGRDQLIRIRTALGHQILMSDDGQTLMILHSNGQSYVELGKEGTVDVYSTNSVNVRTQGDLNLHADNDVNIFAKKDLNVRAENINIQSDKDTKLAVGKDLIQSAIGKHTNKVGGAYSVESGGDASMATGAIAYINGSKVNLNTGKTGTTPEQVKDIPVILHTDTLFDKQKGFIAAPGKLTSIVSRAPAHMPWVNAGQGVDVKVDLSASSQLPAAPSTPINQVNQFSSGAATPVSTSAIASQNTPGAVSTSLDKNTTNAVLGAVQTNTAAGPFASAITQGSAIAQTASGITAGIGSYADLVTPTQLEGTGVLKPGSAILADQLLSAGANLQTALPDSLFTGKAGAENLETLLASQTAQAQVAVTSLQQSQTALTNAGIITGAESPEQIAGVVMAGATNGITQTVNSIRTISSTTQNLGLTNNLPGNFGSQIDGVTKSISSGNFAASLTAGTNGALGSIKQAVGAMVSSPSLATIASSAKGIAASAFDAIKNSLKPLQPGVPQNLKAIAKKSAQNATAATNTVPGSLGQTQIGIQSQLTNSVSQTLDSFKTAAGNIQPDSINIFSATNTISGLESAAQTVASGGISSVSATLASGINNMPGGQKTISAIVNKAELTNTTLSKLPGVDQLSTDIKDASTSVMNKLSLPNIPSIDSLSALASSGLPAGAASQLQAQVSALSSGGTSIKLPTVAINTTARAEIEEATTNLLGDPAIPPPNLLGEISEEAKSLVEEVELAKQERYDAALELSAFEEKIEKAYLAYKEAQYSLPKGDPGINAKFEEWKSLLGSPERKELIAKVEGPLAETISQTAAASSLEQTVTTASRNATQSGTTG
jgi:hypothetical protein